MFSKPASSAPKTAEHRGNRREPMIGVTAMVRSQHGALREGVVQDVSDGGVGISGDSTGLCLGEMVDVVLVIQGDHVAYKGQLRHVGDRFFGVRFLSGPHRTTERQGMKQCRACKKEYPHEHSYCFRCGQRLVGGSVRPQSANPKPLLS